MSASTWSPTQRAYGLSALTGLLVLAGYVLSRPKGLFFDEVFLFEQVRRLGSASSLVTWLRANDSVAMGPIHSFLYYALWGPEPAAAPWLRLPNLLLLVATLILIGAIVKASSRGEPALVALAAMSVPLTWVIGGMALSEIPALACLSLALLSAVKVGAAAPEDSAKRRRWLALLALGLSLAICTRQTYIVIVPAVGLLAWGRRQPWAEVMLALAAALVAPAVLFLIWGGLTPPPFRGLTGIEFKHAIMAVCNLGAVSALLAPRFFLIRWRKILVVAAVAGLIQFLFRPLEMTPLASVHRLIANPLLSELGIRGLNAALVFTGTAWAVSLIDEGWSGKNITFLGLAAGVLLLCGACAGLKWQYSNRYAAMALPFLLPLLAPWFSFGTWALARLIAGMTLSAIVLHTYYLYA